MAIERDISCDRATADDMRTRARDTSRIHRLIAEIRALHSENDKLREACQFTIEMGKKQIASDFENLTVFLYESMRRCEEAIGA